MSAEAVTTEEKTSVRRGKPKAQANLRIVEGVRTDPSRDALLTDFGKKTLDDRYVLPGESYQDMFARVAFAYSDDAGHAQRIYDYISKLWFMPATPVLSNGGADRGLPISCFLNGVSDSLDGIVETWNENVWLASNGGGIGTYWGEVRSIGEKVGQNGQTSGIIPFIRVMDSLTLAISQGSLRRGSAACYLDVFHPEIEEFLEIRKAAGDFNRKSLNLHHGINITDEFMEAVRQDAPFQLKSPKSGTVMKEISARKLWQKILELRMATGEPYLLFTDTVNNSMPAHQRQLGFKVRQSNLTQIASDKGMRIENVDSSLIAEAPKVNPHAAAMKKNIAAALGIQPDQVGVKATTNERLGFVGREEGIAAMAVACISKI
jgi:ribonucleoside-diphosphate reductase alpha chain